jgi:hypothetical protein
VGDGVSDDSDKIQFCLDSYIGKIIFVPTGVFITTKPLIVPSQTILKGSSTQGTVIKKTTATADINNIKAVLILKSKEIPLEYNSDTTICDLFLFGGFTQISVIIKNDYGIYADKCSTLKLDKVWITNCDTGFYSSDAFLVSFYNVNISECQFGIKIRNGTSFTGNTVYCVNCDVGYSFENLRYSTLNSCGCDNASYIAYFFEVCQGFTLNSCGAESQLSNGFSVFNVNNSNIIINSTYILSTAFYGKGIFYAQNNSQVLLNNPTLRIVNTQNKFITSENNSIVTLDELYNSASNFTGREAYIKTDKFLELTGGIINKPIKQSIFL